MIMCIQMCPDNAIDLSATYAASLCKPQGCREISPARRYSIINPWDGAMVPSLVYRTWSNGHRFSLRPRP